MVSQPYVTETHNTYVINGNSALFKCEIPSFVTDFVYVEGWVDGDGQEFFAQSGHVNFRRPALHPCSRKANAQPLRVLHELVLPWIVDRLFITLRNPLTVVTQNYIMEASNAYVIVGNAALMNCEIPSFVSDLVEVVSWEDEDGTVHTKNSGYGT